MKTRGNALILQSGGPTAVINQSLAGIYSACKDFPDQIVEVYGAQHGLYGVLHENLLDLNSAKPESWEYLTSLPGAALGSARIKPHYSDFGRIFEVFHAHNIRFLLYIGGNDSAEAAQLIANEAKQRRYSLRILLVPKTIDNDLMGTDHCPGYGTAAKVVSCIIAGDDLDNRSFYNSVKINIVMGRHAGWIAAAAALARRFSALQHEDEIGPHLIYIPELEFNEQKFIEDVQKTYNRVGRVTAVVAEGIADQLEQDATIHEQDEFGNSFLSASGKLGDYLCSLVRKNLVYNAGFGKLRCRADTLGYLQRSFLGISSETDKQDAELVGKMAVHSIVNGETEKMVSLVRTAESSYRCTTSLCDLAFVAQKTRQLPRCFFNAEANGVTEDFYSYALPLIGKLPSFQPLLEVSNVQKRLNDYVRQSLPNKKNDLK